jgi:DNA-binding IclR family transcriptional regulator
VTDPSPDERSGSTTGPRQSETSHGVLVAFSVLEVVADQQPIGVSAIARQTGLSKTTVQRALYTLQSAGYIFQTSDPVRWRMTLRAVTIGAQAAAGFELRELARPEMERLLAVTQEAIHLNVLEGREMVVLEKLDSPRAVAAYTERGARVPSHASASGKAILAYLPSDEVDAALPETLERFTPTTIVSRTKLREEFVKIREQGYAINDGERRADVVVVGAAVFDGSERPIGGLSVSAPRHRIDKARLRAIADEVVQSSKRVSRLVSGSEPS